MQKIVQCRLVINRVIEGKEEISVMEGKGYYSISNYINFARRINGAFC